MSVFAGIDLAAGRGVTEVALLDASDTLRLPYFSAEAHRVATSDEAILAALGAAEPDVIAIDAPLSLPAAVHAALIGQPLPPGSAASPYTRAAERDAYWSELGLRPLPVSFLGGLTFRALTLVPRLRAALPQARIVEVFPSATLRALGIRLPIKGIQRAAKSSVTARQTVQAELAMWIEGLPAPEPEPLGADLLDALAAALTAVLYARGQYRALGDEREGQIIIPHCR